MGSSNSTPSQDDQSQTVPDIVPCTFNDSSELYFRLAQLELLNRAILLISQELCKGDRANFESCQTNVMAYVDTDGNEVPDHEWDILANDMSFTGPAEQYNPFTQFGVYFLDNPSNSQTQIAQDFANFYHVFLRLRDSLVKFLASSCL